MKFKTTKRDITFLEKTRFSYTIRGFKKAAQWTDYLIKNIKNQKISDYEQDFREIEITLEQEINSLGAYPKKYYFEIKKIFAEARAKPIKPLLEDIFPYADNYMSALPNIKTIFEVSEN